jgi:ferric-dicitrate binding protein FerR (iron transport regulator)
MDQTRITYLLRAYEEDSIATAELEELYTLLRSFEEDEAIMAWLEQSYKETLPQPVNPQQWQPMLQHILEQPVTRVVPIYSRKNTWVRWVAAASMIGLVFLGLWYFFGHKADQPSVALTTEKPDVNAPEKTRAMITLADGRQVYLDSAGNGTLAQQSGVNVVKNADGKIRYQLTANSQQLTANSLVYNTLTNPRGSRVIDMQLSDGSHVWLNAGSSLKYPVAFVGKERKVEITGEAYFEVAHNASKHFKVALPGEVGEVEVLGTHFNINAYDDEDALKVTLLEGSVRFSASSTKQIKSSTILKPGEQGQLQTTNYKLQTIPAVDIDEVMAWKNGRFSFNGSDLQTIMRQVARWYDVEIVYQDKINEKFFAEMPRDTRASDVLKALELTGKVHFKIEGKKIKVTK